MKYYKLEEEEKNCIEDKLTQVLMCRNLLRYHAWINIYDFDTIIFGLHYYTLQFDVSIHYSGKEPRWDTKRIKFIEKLIGSKVNAKDEESIFLTDEQFNVLNTVLKIYGG